MARQLTIIGPQTILENRRQIQLLQNNDYQQEKKMIYMAALKEKRKRPIKSSSGFSVGLPLTKGEQAR